MDRDLTIDQSSAAQLTNEQIAKVVAMYYNADVTWLNWDNNWKHVEYGWPQAFERVKESGLQANWRLSLTDLPDISDEDAIELLFLSDPLYKDKTFEVVKFYKRKNLVIEADYRYKHPEEARNNKDGYSYSGVGLSLHKLSDLQSQHLVQKGYAVPLFIAPGHPLNGKTAIELGIAFDKIKALIHY